MSQWVTGEIVEIIHWTDTLFSIKFIADIAPFKAGQYTKISLQRDGKRVARAYSFVNSPESDLHEILLVEVKEGLLTPPLHQLKVGDEIEVAKQANGFFTLDELPQCDTLWMISTGTAIGPFLSMLMEGSVWQQIEQVILIHGVRLNNDLCYRAELESLQNNQPKFTYVPLITREQPQVGLSGRVTELIDNGALLTHLEFDDFPKNSHFMLCGNPEMVKALSSQLQNRGYARHRRAKPGQITVEQYW
ncbi:ferredoxin--NADP reductase [Pseudoalteromonas piscicida]|uniref:ferredoxin--NADP(+) reductase n=1 Tax=Pseudoalteromonas piscicida TaxID=43662 RepID=A0A2A5JU17_PSEO7|nr:ferredoxin--NADP reductase [Pseudoalteromonas piscicida]PCK32963.1 ferredoxin--NADP(+) reductase [Pseudoalteromonas piscicida]